MLRGKAETRLSRGKGRTAGMNLSVEDDLP